ncbi:MAG: YvcK family protein [Candidatus Pacebacteria bacterium]|jgi:uncharacterized cofD-like protein|nr:YvcK family protein [Candidatus Paceibacterota bacterium]MBT3512289.1 YvcK family protein [Candidatus Paceibacterota bacterium]MBT4004517.1 YvcK family protein [Candidatus Paceibacterota bacterium]MBT4358849.1 YvcK family protein [Candidatus Paceibacterota bacterium]MBT4681202.1 YvcK family protein [Candidatus Paceibacterota bacterium]
MQKTPHVVILGGGTGSYVVASGLNNMPVKISMLLTMVDDGGSNQTLRDEFGLLPTSGIRQAIVALADNQTILRELFTYRFHQGGKSIEGMTFGNLFMAAMADIMGSQKKGIEETCRLLQVKGDIIPVSYDDVRLVATYEDGSQVIGEHHIDEPTHNGKLKITNLETKPEAKLSPEARQALLDADLIILGPGDFFTNTIANLIIDGVVETIKKSSAKLLFISNLMTKYGEAYNYTARDYFTDLTKYLPLEEVDYVLINNNTDFPEGVLPLYEKEHSIPVKDDLKPSDLNGHVKLIRTDLLSRFTPTKTKGDVLKRSMIRHDPSRLTNAIMKLLKK